MMYNGHCLCVCVHKPWSGLNTSQQGDSSSVNSSHHACIIQFLQIHFCHQDVGIYFSKFAISFPFGKSNIIQNWKVNLKNTKLLVNTQMKELQGKCYLSELENFITQPLNRILHVLVLGSLESFLKNELHY